MELLITKNYAIFHKGGAHANVHFLGRVFWHYQNIFALLGLLIVERIPYVSCLCLNVND